MDNRGDGEPEYIDDDDFYDPDGLGDSGGRRSKVLGGSGSRQARADERGLKDERKPGKAERKAAKARNPAPSVASSEERRARLAGKHQSKPSRSESRKQPETSKSEADKSEPERGGWRSRFSRAGKSARGRRDRSARGGSSRMAAVAGKLGALRGRLRRRGSKDERAGKASPSGSGRFGASRGPSRPAESRRGDAASRQRDDKAASAARARPSKTPKIASGDWLDLDRKLDLIGVGLVFGAIVFVFSALSPEQAAIGSIHTILGQLLGWGAVAVPVAMFAVGLWLIVRHFGDEPPIIDPLRLSGVALAYLSALVLMQFLDSLGYPEQCGRDCIGQAVQAAYQDGRGGGLAGGWLYSALVINLTELGGFVAVFMTLTIAAMLTTRSSMVELSVVVISLSRNLRTRIGQAAAQRRAARLQAQEEPLSLAQEESPVHIRKPEPAQLGATPMSGRALPAPRGNWMPIPTRLRDFFGRGLKSEAASESETLAAEASAEPQDTGVARRRWSRPRVASAPAQAAQSTGPAGRLERFLNLGDDLPPAAVSPAPPATPVSPRAPIRPVEPRPEPAKIAPVPEPVAETEKAESAPANGGTPDPAAATASIEAPKSEPDAGASSEEKGRPDPAPPKPAKRAQWDLPDYQALLNAGTASDFDEAALQQQAQIIEDTLASFGAPGRVVEVNSGPVITQYGVEPAYITAKTGKRNRVKVGAIAKLDKDLQLALGARSLRMEAPVPGKGYVGIEVPNPVSARVGLRDVMESSAYQKIDSPLAIALGMSVDGQPMAADLTQMPHLLIAGTTGSGKSVCVNAIINSILANNSPESVRFIMVDPKRVELTGYNGLPHLVAPVVVELERIIGVLRWVTTEMDERYKKFSRAGARNIIDYNSILDPDLPAMPYIVVIIDELADLMMMAPDDTERAIARIAALARATGIHLVIATQRPSVDVVTGLIKANCPARIAFAVAGSVDSRVIIDQPGAERLLGKGDMLYLSGDRPAPQRAQGVHVSNEEIQRISRFWKLQKHGIAGVEAIPLPPKASATGPPASGADPAPKKQTSEQGAFWDMSAASAGKGDGKGGNMDPDEDELYQTAVDMVRRLEKASVSLLQRRLRIGYTRAARLVDMMETRGVVGPPKEGSSKPRDVLKQ